MTSFALGWQEIASALRGSDERRPKASRGQGKVRGRRVISQETVRQIREDALTMKRAEIAAKHGVSIRYVENIVAGGLRDDERERLK